MTKRRLVRWGGLAAGLAAIGVGAGVLLWQHPAPNRYELYREHLRAAGVTEKSAKFPSLVGPDKDYQADVNASTYLGNTVCNDMHKGAAWDTEIRKMQLEHMFSPKDANSIVTWAVRDLCPGDQR